VRVRSTRGCWACAVYGIDYALPGDLECSGPVQRHHLLAQRWLKGVHSPLPAEWLPIVLEDDRNIVPVRWLHHEAIESGRLEISRAVVEAQGIMPFVDDYGLEAMLDRYYPVPVRA
jgi:hypothetical protein